MELVAEKYKQTEVGLIPSDWEVVQIQHVAQVIGGGTPSTYNSHYWNGNINWFTPTEIGNQKYSFESLRKLTLSGLKNSSAKILPAGTILLTSRASIGDTSILKVESSTNQGFQSLIANKTIDNEFLYYSINCLKKQLIENASGSTFLEISPRKVKEIKIPLPPTKDEQTAIATALGDMDALIASQEKLIDKKKAIKQGAMQQLLKPKNGWVVKKLGELINILDNLRVPLNDNQRSQMKGDIPYCGANGIVDYVNDYVIDDDIILMAEDGGYFDEYRTRPIAYRMKGKCWVNNHAHILQANNENDQGFLYFSLVHKNILDFINGGTRAKLNKGDLINIEIATPHNKSEQNSIALILDDIDFEILEIENNLVKFKMIKQGMMQELLTGKTRLI